ncbi:MAG: DUF4340 domain-containing protein [Sandaracinaceae bacterium]
MDWQKNRLWIGLVALIALGGGAIWAVRSRTGDSPAATGSATIEGFPSDIERDDIRSIEITRPDEPTVRLERGEGGWRVTAPVESRADQTSVDTALDKITELELESVAARNARHHEELEVDPAHGIHVVVGGADGTLANFWIGVTRSGNTALRVEGQDAVGMANGSIRFAFSRDLKDWRDRTILDVESDSVREVAWVGPNGTFRFTRPMNTPTIPADTDAGAEPPAPTPGDWTIAEVSYVPTAEGDAGAPAGPRTTIDGFQPSKVRTLVSGLARLRAADFAAQGVTREQAGFTESSPRVTLTIGDGASATREVIRLGGAVPEATDQFYAMHEGDDTIFVVSRYHSTRIHPTVSEFQASSPPPTPSSGESSGTPDIQVGGGGQIPPDVMRQIQQQLQQQGAHP